MHIKRKKVNYLDGEKGILSISPKIEFTEDMFLWIKNKKYTPYEISEYRMDRHTRKRNNLYSFSHPLTNTNVILKVSKIDKKYKFSRRINLIISTFFNDYNFRAYKGGLLLKNIDISCAEPIAYWTESGFLYRKKSYYMYEKVNSDDSLFSFSEKLLLEDTKTSEVIFTQLAKKTVQIVKKIHDAGFRQGDPHPGNFLITPPNKNIRDLNEHDIHQTKMFIIDLDKFSVAKPLGKTIKTFFDLRCMRRCTLGPYNQHDMLKFYLQENYSKFWGVVLSFWIRGGFNPFKWFKPPKRGR